MSEGDTRMWASKEQDCVLRLHSTAGYFPYVYVPTYVPGCLWLGGEGKGGEGTYPPTKASAGFILSLYDFGIGVDGGVT